MSIYDKYNLKIINQITYIGKRKEEPLGFIERETVFKYMGITYVRVPAQEAQSCKGCAFKDIDCSTTKMPNRPACSDWIYRVKIA
jgi:hypothetical protein